MSGRDHWSSRSVSVFDKESVSLSYDFIFLQTLINLLEIFSMQDPAHNHPMPSERYNLNELFIKHRFYHIIWEFSRS